MCHPVTSRGCAWGREPAVEPGASGGTRAEGPAGSRQQLREARGGWPRAPGPTGPPPQLCTGCLGGLFFLAQQERLVSPVAGKGECPWGTGSWAGVGELSSAGRPGWLYALTSWDPRRGP